MEEVLAFRNGSAIHWPEGGGPPYMMSHGHRIEIQGATASFLSECAALLGIAPHELASLAARNCAPTLPRIEVAAPIPLPAGPLAVWDNGEEYAIAESAADAEEVCRQFTGSSLDLLRNPEEVWDRVSGETVLTIELEGHGAPTFTLTCAEWVARKGRCWLGSRDG